MESGVDALRALPPHFKGYRVVVAFA